jgi:hypothetical protein
MPGLPVPAGQSSALLFGRYRGNQYAIGHRVEAAIGGLWAQMIDPAHFNDSWHRLEPLISGIVDTHHDMSAADAAEYYSLSRAVAGFYGATVPGVTLSDEYRSHVINVMGVGQFFHFLGDGDDAPTASVKALDALKGASSRLVMNGGRDTVLKAASSDDNSLGWERILESDHKACNYCSMLTGSTGVQKESAARFHAHDSCYCLARSVFNGQQSVNAGIQAEWKSVTTGKQGKAATAAWNQYWSEKDVGPERGSSTGTAQEEAGNAAVGAESERLAAISNQYP